MALRTELIDNYLDDLFMNAKDISSEDRLEIKEYLYNFLIDQEVVKTNVFLKNLVALIVSAIIRQAKKKDNFTLDKKLYLEPNEAQNLYELVCALIKEFSLMPVKPTRVVFLNESLICIHCLQKNMLPYQSVRKHIDYQIY